MMKQSRALAAMSLAFACSMAIATERPDASLVKRAAEQFVARETAGLPGRITYTIGALDPQLALPVCRSVEAFLPSGSRLWGNATLGMRCTGPAPWTVYLPVEVRVYAGVVHTTRAIPQGQPIAPADLEVQQADLTRLPAGVVTDVGLAMGKTLITSLQPGQPLRADLLRAPNVVQPGQPVKLLVQGRGFTVTGEGRALTAAIDGQLVQVRVQSGLVVSGLARAGATVEVRQ
ncbi:MAG: flagellar basal body P-ring formation chaperone FlgA [Rhodospirillaceae bacterium]